MKAELIFFATPQSASWLVDIIIWIVKISSSIALGVVLFTVLLKLITLPFDIISRVQTRKNSLIMERMRPELEKLQKQYANDKQLYQQKMMAEYKKNGYSMFGACLPTIVTLIIFIVAINGFNSYSQFQNKVYFYEMSLAFNTSVYQGIEVDEDLIKKEYKIDDDDGIYTLYFDNQKIVETAKAGGKAGYEIQLDSDENGAFYTISSESGYVDYKFYYVENQITNAQSGEYLINVEKLKSNVIYGEDFKKFISDNPEITDEKELAKKFVSNIGSVKSAERYHKTEDQRKFLWVKNIWAVDSPMAHPVETMWEAEAGQVSCLSCASGSSGGFKIAQGYSANEGEEENMNKERYALLIANLEEEQQSSNGFFILAILTAGISLLSQIVLSKGQKAAMELQTVDGRGAQQQKMMMWMMPVMMAIFSFMYTATFSIYMILSQAMTIVFTLLTNYFIDKKFAKEHPERNAGKIHGRVYTPEVKEEPKTSRKNKKEEQTPDFINGGNKHLRGRKK